MRCATNKSCEVIFRHERTAETYAAPRIIQRVFRLAGVEDVRAKYSEARGLLVIAGAK